MNTNLPLESMSYDPGSQGYDTSVWKELGAAPVINGTSLFFNVAQAVSKASFGRGVFYFELTVPTAPTAGDYRAFGLKDFGTGASAQFIINGTTVTAYVSDGEGNSDSDSITWNDSWTNTETVFRINFSPAEVVFHIGDNKVSILNSTGSPKRALRFFVRNDNADNLSLNGVTVRAADIYTTSLDASGSISVSSTPSTSTTTAEPYAHYQNNSFTSAVVKDAPGVVYSLSFINTTGATRYIQLHNATAALSGGETALYKMLVPANSAAVIGTDWFGEGGGEFDNGIVVANSTTATTFTAGTGGDILVDVHYDGAGGASGYVLLETSDAFLLENGDFVALED